MSLNSSPFLFLVRIFSLIFLSSASLYSGVISWGAGQSGQLGNGVQANSANPGEVGQNGSLAGRVVVQASNGGEHSLAVTADGEVHAWGRGVEGQLGDGAHVNRSLPVRVTGFPAGTRIVAVAAGGSHSLALGANGWVYAWGDNGSGQLGLGDTVQRNSPTRVSVPQAKAISAGAAHSLALTQAGTIRAWGSDGNEGRLGTGTTLSPNFSTVPLPVDTSGVLSGKTIKAISAGQQHSLGLTSDGLVVAWGRNFEGQLGTAENLPFSVSAAPVLCGGSLTGKTVAAIAVGSLHSFALTSDGSVHTWGANNDGVLGDASPCSRFLPAAVSTASTVLDGRTIRAIAGSGLNCYALCSDGILAAWGSNGTGALGTGSFGAGSATPVIVPLAAVADGQIAGVCAGSGFASVTTTSTVHTVEATSVTRSSATPRGAVYTGGETYNVRFEYGPTAAYGSTIAGDPSPVSGHEIHQVSAAVSSLDPVRTYHFRVVAETGLGDVYGEDRTFTTGMGEAIFTAGTSVFGDGNDLVPAGVPSRMMSLFPPSASAAGFAKILEGAALTRDGKMYVWGYVEGLPPQVLLVPTEVTDLGGLAGKSVVDIGNAGHVFLALTSDGEVYTWGLGAALGNGQPNLLVQQPTRVLGALAGKFVTRIFCEDFNAFAATSTGELYAWGENAYGALGVGTDGMQAVPTPVGGLVAGKDIIDISLGGYFTTNPIRAMALSSDGQLYMWGRGIDPDFDGVPEDSLVPTLVDMTPFGGVKPQSVSMNTDHAWLVLDQQGRIWTWGSNSDGLLGPGPSRNAPQLAGGELAGKVFTKASLQFAGLALTADGSLYGWGKNRFGMLGLGFISASNDPPIEPTLLNSAAPLSGRPIFDFHSRGLATIVVAPGLPTPTITQREPFGNGFNAAAPAGIINARGHEVSVAIEFGTDTSYGTNLSVFPGTVNGAEDTVVFGNAFNLLPSTTYHYRFVLTYAGGSLVGPDESFTTPTPVLSAQTQGLQALTSHSATLGGVVNPGGSEASVTFEYGLSESLGTSVPATPSTVTGMDNVSVSRDLTGLLPQTSYRYRVVATRGGETVYGTILSFTTPQPPPPPLIFTTPASSVSANSAFVNGMVISNGNSVSLSFEYGTTQSYGTTVNAFPSSVPGTISFAMATLPLQDLLPGTTYHFRLVGTTSEGVVRGSNFSFTTTSGPFEAWRILYFGSPSNGGNAANDADPDGDGLSNLMEFALGLNPQLPDSGNNAGGGVELGEQMVFTYTRSAAALTEVLFTVEWTDSISDGPWSTDGVSPEQIENPAGPLQTVHVTIPKGSSGKRFVRLRVSPLPEAP